jgi:hypothetical protein
MLIPRTRPPRVVCVCVCQKGLFESAKVLGVLHPLAVRRVHVRQVHHLLYSFSAQGTPPSMETVLAQVNGARSGLCGYRGQSRLGRAYPCTLSRMPTSPCSRYRETPDSKVQMSAMAK